MSAPNKGHARRVLRDSIARLVVPELERRGFRCFLQSKGGPPSWMLCRKRPDAGFDIIAIKLHDGAHPWFDAFISVLPAEKVQKEWQGSIQVDAQTVIEFPDQVTLASRVINNRMLRAVTRSWGVGWFGFKATENGAQNHDAAGQACVQFIGCLDQAEQWWRNGSIGPNLVVTRAGGVAR